ncbi:uncharacterized protein LOC114931463 isoform X2 [Nylanderia fulva]|uniref:uncharacterized protein LOC114931463 isoform X2 n=1 Tax=Nylanderia fulva TaxID=613905 RepID=UPI0010FB9466|nr:uncharacterized protein LOC114931463 isoform X2 [Nylanderia fulva]
MPQQISTDVTIDSNRPKLRKNRKVENKWGSLYQIIVDDAVFGYYSPYMPTEPPASLSEEIVESDPLYVCKQCKDSFRFQSSFENHNKRRSWILGLWCHNCFITICTHATATGYACPLCMKKDSDKRSYLRIRGLMKNQKLGVTRVFYNQCQFFEHVKKHGISTVDMGDLMLMPLPGNMNESDWSPEVEILCEALMERTFLSRVHIMDWLKIYNLEDNWWKLSNGKSNNNVINKVVEGYQGRQLFKPFEESTEFIDLIFSGNVDITDSSIKDKDANNYFVNKREDKNVSENEDNPCMSTDIAFVDCGPAAQDFESELASYIPYRKRLTVVTKSTHGIKSSTNVVKINNKKQISTCKDFSSLKTNMTSGSNTTVKMEKSSNKNVIRQSPKKYGKKCGTAESLVKKENISKPIIETDINKILDNPIKLPISDKILISGKKVLPKILPKTNSNHLEQEQTSSSSSKLSTTKSYSSQQDQISNSNSKMLNVQSSQNSQNADKKIISKTNSDNLEQDLQTSINNNSKQLNVQTAANTDITSIIDQIPSHLISNKLVVIGPNLNKVITCDKNEVSTEKRSSILVLNNSNDTDNMSSQKKMCNSVSMKKQEKILIKNGKKYFIKHPKNVTKDIENPSNLPIENSTTKTGKRLAPEHNTSISTSNSSKAENNDVEQMASFSNDITILTPSPSPSESSSSSGWINESNRKSSITSKLRNAPPQAITAPSASGTIQRKYMFETISLTEKNGDVYMDVKIVDRISKEGFRDTFEVIPKYRDQMIKDFQQLCSFELKERINHLQLAGEEMRTVLNFLSSNVLWEKSRSINTLQCILEKCLQKCNQDTMDKRNDDDDVTLTEWESKISKMDLHKCPSCKRLIKPKSYIPGFSKLSKNENLYCSCYKLICHECQCYQEHQSRFTAHQNYHKKCKPYICPNCDSKFTSVRSLEVHTWTVCFHTLKKFTIACKICEIDGFRDMESITRHIVTMHSTTKIACEECRKVLSSYNEYVKHSTETHPSIHNQNPIRLVKCKLGNVIIRFENFMLYADMHPAIRKKIWFKCPFCSLITVENKHTTTVLNDHLRNKHFHRLSEIISKEALHDIFGTEFLTADVNVVSETPVDTFTNEETNNTVIPKIVNARTISSEIFEHGAENEISLWKYGNSNLAWSNIEIKRSKMENVDDKQNVGSLPKILNVKSMNNLKSSKPKEAIAKTSTESKEKSNSQFPQAKTDEKNDPLAGKNTKRMKLNDSKSDNKEEIEKIEEPDKINNESLVSTDMNDVRVNSLIESCKKPLDLEFTSKSSIDGRIKVVDIKKICKPNIEPFVTVEPKDTSMKEDENTSYTTFVSQPPPLIKISQHLFESMKVYKPDNSKNVARMNKSFVPRIKNNKKTKERFAIHGTDTQETNVDYMCHLCGERINTSTSVMQTHFQERHLHECKLAIITPRLTRMSPDFINDGYKQFISSKKRKADSAFLASKRKRRWTPKKHAETKDANAPVGLCVEQETAEDGEGNFKCKKCDQRCTDMSDLREHIAANHRLKGRYLICLECGENFVVAPSLQMHLKAFHGIEDPINYMNQNPSYAPGIDGDSEAEGKTTVANQCYVCMAVFEDKAAVDKHLRVHGMAFLNRKRIEARNALRSPEKKTNVEEDKQNVAKDTRKETVKQDKPAEIILEKLNVTI